MQNLLVVRRGRGLARGMGLGLLSTSLWAATLWRDGPTPYSIACAFFISSLVVLSWTDLRTKTLPNVLTLPLIPCGLALSLLPGSYAGASPLSALLGTLAGYGLLWLAYQYYLWRTGLEGLGYGDFKLAAGIGAWLGLSAVIDVLVLAAGLGLVVGLALRWRGKLKPHQEMPFGPFLASAAILLLLAGPSAVARI